MGSILGKGAPKTQTTTTTLDPLAQQFRQEAYQKAGDVANQGYTGYGGQRVMGADPYSTGAAGGMAGMGQNFLNMGQRAQGMQFGGGLDPNAAYSQAGITGAQAMGGDPNAISKLMNPYQQNVIDAMGTQYDRLRGKAQMGANSDATMAGAFGGDRAALMSGERLGALDRQQGSDIANLLHGGYNDMMGQAGNAAQLGSQYSQMVGNQRLAGQGMQLDANGQAINAGQGAMDAYGRQFGMGDTLRGYGQDQLNSNQDMFNQQRDWGLRGVNVLNSTMGGAPAGQTTSQPLYNNRGAGALGGATMGAKFGPWGALAGGAAGALGLFG